MKSNIVWSLTHRQLCTGRYGKCVGGGVTSYLSKFSLVTIRLLLISVVESVCVMYAWFFIILSRKCLALACIDFPKNSVCYHYCKRVVISYTIKQELLPASGFILCFVYESSACIITVYRIVFMWRIHWQWGISWIYSIARNLDHSGVDNNSACSQGIV